MFPNIQNKYIFTFLFTGGGDLVFKNETFKILGGTKSHVKQNKKHSERKRKQLREGWTDGWMES